MVHLCYKKDGAVRDLVLVGPGQRHTVRPEGYTSVDVDVSMVVGSHEHPASTTLAFTSGGTRPPITGIRVVSEDVLRDMMAAAATATAAVNSDAALVDAALEGVVPPAVADAFGWEEIGRLPGGRCVIAKRGQGSPIVSLAVYRAPTVVPRFGQSCILSLLPGDALSRLSSPSSSSSSSSSAVARPGTAALRAAYECALGRWQMKSGDMRSIFLQAGVPGSDAPVAVTGYLVRGLVGRLTQDAVDSDQEEGAGTIVPYGGLEKTGEMRGVVYRCVDARQSPGQWSMFGQWTSVADKSEDPYPCSLQFAAAPAVGVAETSQVVAAFATVGVSARCPRCIHSHSPT
jgi:hypothetical protein